MSNYTTKIKDLIDNGFDFKMTSYPIFDEDYRTVLNSKILGHYYMSEIGFETAALFRFYLNQTLGEIMPYYNILYENQFKLLQNIDKDVNLEERLQKEKTGTTSSTISNSDTTQGNESLKNLYLATPQGTLSSREFEDIDHATNLTWDKNSNDSSSIGLTSGTGTENGTESYIKTIIGNNGGKYTMDILRDLRNNLVNVDLQVIDDLSDLFMGVF